MVASIMGVSIKSPLLVSGTDNTFGVHISGSKIYCSQRKNPENMMNKFPKPDRAKLLNHSGIRLDEEPAPLIRNSMKKNLLFERKNGFLKLQDNAMVVLCGFGYYVDGLRGFPWLALNYHMSHNLCMHPSTLQLIQNSGNLPMVAKPLYGILSDAVYFGGGRRIPYISIGVFLQVLSWGSLALIPKASEARTMLLGCVLMSNLGASISEVAKDALTAEYGQKNKISGLQSYAFMASAVGGILGNLVGGLFLLKTQQTKSMFLMFAVILTLQLTLSLRTREESLGLYSPQNHVLPRESIPKMIMKQWSNLMIAIGEEGISLPLIWVVSSILVIPVLSGSQFCYQTQCLNLDPFVIGLSKVTGQMLLFSFTIFYNMFWKPIPLRKLAHNLQLLYAFSLLLDLLLVKQINVRIGIPNKVFALCFSGLAETIAQFKLLPFHVYFASLAPPGCEASLMSFLASTLCLSSILSGFLGVGLASFLGITYGDYSKLPFGIAVQFIAALLPILWINNVPLSLGIPEKARRIGRSKRNRRNRRIGRVVFDSVHCYRRERESDLE